MFEYLNNNGENFKQLSLYLAYRKESNVMPPFDG